MAPKLPAFDPEAVPALIGTDYPPPFDEVVGARKKRRLGEAARLSNFGVNLVTLPQGCASSQRHWHSLEDEFVYVLRGELVLITDDGEQTLGPGMAAGFPAGSADGHQLVNRSHGDAVYLEVGDRRSDDVCSYSDIDLHLARVDGELRFTHKDGRSYDQ